MTRTDTRQTVAQFAEKYHVRVWSADRVDANPHMDDSRDMDHWKVRLRRTSTPGQPNASMTVYFSMGFGHNGKAPKVTEVLNALALDAGGYDNARGDFESWAGEYGYDTDSRKAEKTFKLVAKQAARVRAFLGDEAYDELLYRTESL